MLLYTDSVLWTIYDGLELFLTPAVLLYTKLCVSKPHKQLPSEVVRCAIVSTSQSLKPAPIAVGSRGLPSNSLVQWSKFFDLHPEELEEVGGGGSRICAVATDDGTDQLM